MPVSFGPLPVGLANGWVFDIVLVDAELETRDGSPLLREIAAIPQLKACEPVVLLSAIEQSKSHGEQEVTNVHCLIKPAKYSELLDALIAALPPREGVTPELLEREVEENRALDILLVEDGQVNREVA